MGIILLGISLGLLLGVGASVLIAVGIGIADCIDRFNNWRKKRNHVVLVD